MSDKPSKEQMFDYLSGLNEFRIWSLPDLSHVEIEIVDTHSVFHAMTLEECVIKAMEDEQ